MRESNSPYRPGVHRMVVAAIALALTVALSPLSVDAQENGNNRPTQADGSPQEPIFLDFDDVSLDEVIETLGPLTGRNFEIPASANLAAKKVTIISHHAIRPDMAYDVLEAILNNNELALVETLQGNLVRVVPKPRAGQANIGADKLEIFKGEPEPHLGFDNFAIHIVQLKYVSAEEAAEFLKKVGSPNADTVVFQNTNTLLIIDTADGIKNMFEVLKAIDIPGYELEVEIFPLEFTRAEIIADQLNQVLGDTETSGPARPGQPARPQPRNPRTAAIPGQPETTVVGSGEETLRMVPDERLNSLIVVASASMMTQVRYMIERLDTLTPYDSNNMHYVPLLHTSAESVAAVLTSVTSTAPREGATPAANSGEIQPFEKKVIITPYEDNNALVIIASPQDFDVLEELILQLDTPRKQVNIEAIIMEVTLGTAHQLNVEAAAVDSESFFGLANVANIANAISGGPASLAGPGGTIGIIDGTTDIMVGGTTQTVQNVPLLIKALETITDVEILSRPNLLMKDNTAGSLTVGQEIPIPTAQSDINPNSGFQSRNQISRRDVGIKLVVTPQINDGEYVSMEIEVESSSAVSSSVGIDPNTTGATIAQSLITSEVVVQDGQTGIIGGLIRESQDRSVSQIPILGDIPLLGILFRGKASGRDRQNLVILVTPRIINRSEDMLALTKNKVDGFYDYNADAIFEQGFIKKVKAKHNTRTTHRPTNAYRENPSGAPADSEMEILDGSDNPLFNTNTDVSKDSSAEAPSLDTP